MITTGIIRKININSSNYIANKYKVELNLFQTPGDLNKNNYTLDANYCHDGSVFASLKEGDTVYVGFLNDDLSYPIILGKIYKGIEKDCSGFSKLSALKVSGSSELSADTKLGDITYEDLLTAVKSSKSTPTNYFNHIITITDKTLKFQLTLLSKHKKEILDINTLIRNIKLKYQSANVPIFQSISGDDAEPEFTEVTYLKYEVQSNKLVVLDTTSKSKIYLSESASIISDSVCEI